MENLWKDNLKGNRKMKIYGKIIQGKVERWKIQRKIIQGKVERWEIYEE